MKKVISGIDGQRVDRPDFDAIHDLTAGEFQRFISQLVSGSDALVVGGFGVALTGAAEPKQITITLGVAIAGETMGDASIKDGQLVGEGDATQVFDFAALAVGTYSVWVRFVYADGDVQNRAYLAEVAGEGLERVATIPTRAVPGWTVTATRDGADPDPGAQWVRIARVAYDGGDLVAGDLVEARELMFEGQGSASGWSVADFNRTDDRGAAPLTTIRAWVRAVAKRLEEIGGRKWHSAPGFGETLRSASGAVTVTSDNTDPGTAHKVLSAPTAADFLALFSSPGPATDRRDTVAFVPTAGNAVSVFDVDVTAAAVVCTQLGGPRLYVRGAGHLRRSAGANNLMTLSNAQAVFEGIGFTASAAGPALVAAGALAASNDVTFRGCKFSSAVATVAAFSATGDGARYRFVDCHFSLPSSPHLDVDGIVVGAGVDVVIQGCTFEGGRYGVQLSGVPKRVEVSSCAFDGCDTGIKGADGGATLAVSGNNFESMTAAAIDVSGAEPIYDAGGAGVSSGAGFVTGAPVSATYVRATSATVYLDDGSQGISGRRVLVESDLLDHPRLTGRDRTSAGARVLNSAFRFVQSTASRFVFGSADGVGPAILRAGGITKLCEITEAGGVETVTADGVFQAGGLILGQDAAQANAKLGRHMTPKAWVSLSVDGSLAAGSQFTYRYATAGGHAVTATWEQDANNSDAQYFNLVGLEDVVSGSPVLVATAHAQSATHWREGSFPATDFTSGRMMQVDARLTTSLNPNAVRLVPYMIDASGDVSLFEGDSPWWTAVQVGQYDLPQNYRVELLVFGAAGPEFSAGGGDAW